MSKERVSAIVVDKKDNVAVALSDIKRGDKVTIRIGEKIEELVARSDIPFGHKLAIREIPRGEEIIKYGEVIGRATRDIEIGEHVHVHNVESLRGRGDLKKE
ncbi:MAG: D-galactarate dehydratase [Candidatus Wolframiiraptor sp.]|nr:MAG: D-galactarate dehydratase [Candidatus Wolframiiraptor sp.]